MIPNPTDRWDHDEIVTNEPCGKLMKETKVTVRFPGSMELTKRNSDNSLALEARRGEEFLGTLLMGRGSVEWWPNGNKVNSVKKSWRDFVNILEEQMK